ncbi:MAG: phytoene desaturase [Ardenticatenaceae bacterium]|nr:phytoene desaturase [Ardenticatenaceae bacterium]
MSKKIIVIGSGFGGLSAALRLQAAGHQVHLIEKRDKLGGRAYVYEKNGFHFDGGPTVVTAPYMFDDLFQTANKKREDYVEFVPISPFYRIFDHHGKYFDYNGETDFVLEQIERWNPADKQGYLNFVEGIKDIFDTGMALIDQPFLKFSDMMKVVPDLIRLQSYRSVYGYVQQFIKDEFLRRCFSFHPLLIGGNPFDSTSIYALIHYLEREWGVWYAMGGTGKIVEGIGRAFEELGGKITKNAEVDEIIIERKRTTGVRLKSGQVLPAEAVVSNADVAFTYLNMIDKQHRSFRNSDFRYKQLTKYSMSLFVIYFGTKRRYLDTNLQHHNIILGERYKALLDDIFNKKMVTEDFSLYLHMPTITDSSIAPEGHENFYVLSPVPHLASGTDWSKAAKPYRDRIMQFLEDNYLPDLQANIVAEHHIDPAHFAGTLNTHLGSAFSVQPILTQSAWFRPHNVSEDVENLYFVGAGTHPGAGMPGVLSSGRIVADLIGAGVPQRKEYVEAAL